VLNCISSPRNQPRLFKIWLRQVIFMILPICLAALVNVNEVNDSDPNLLTEIDLVNGGFRDLRWGMHISDCKDMVYENHKQTSGGNVKIYNRNNENLILGSNIKLSKIEYGFLNNMLLFVALKASDPKQKGIIEETVVLKFGENRKKEQTGNFYWVTDNTNIILQSGAGKPVVLMLVSKQSLQSNFSK